MTNSANTPLQDERFLLLETLGRGAMGSVYRAYDRAEQRLVALKVPSEDEPPGPGHSLSSEFETWYRLRHRNIVQAYELRLARTGPITPDTPYLVLEHVTGGPIHRVLQPGRMEDAVTMAVAAQLLDALDLVHRSGFVHRDLKPANVLVGGPAGSPPEVRLTDFGLAERIGVSREVGVFSGSLPYVSPEALVGGPIDARADFYGLGILLYHLASGAMPCSKSGPREILRWHLSGEPADPRRARADVSDRLARFVQRLTARNPADRPASAEEALRLLGADRTGPRDPVSRRVGRATRASLRLSLDATRLGAARLFRLPPVADDAEALLEEVSVWTQVRGLELHRVGATAAGVARLVLRLALERGGAAVDDVRRSGLSGPLPLAWLGELPIFDPRRVEWAGGGCRSTLRRASRAVCDFILRCARERSMVVCLDATGETDPLGHEVARRLIETASRGGGFARERGGLLVLAGLRDDRAA